MHRFLIAGTTVLLFGALTLCAPVIEVNVGESIQAAIDSAPTGAIIELPPGTWRENLTITKPLILKGAGATKTIISSGKASYPVILVTSQQTISVTIEEIAIAGAYGEGCRDQAGGVRPHGVLVLGQVRLELISCEVTENALCGLFASDQAEVTTIQTTFTHNQTGIWVHSSAQAQLEQATVFQNDYGLIASTQANLVVRGSTIADNARDGVLVADGARVYLWQNEIAKNGRVGVCLDIPSCYRTQRVFTGLVRGAGNTVPPTGDPDGNGLAPFCPKDLVFLRSKLGGIYPAPSPAALFSRLPLPPPMLGSPLAPVVMIEFSDFSCPYCARFTLEVLPQLREEYIDTGKVRLYFLPFPVHGEAARKEAEVAFCAAAQGVFWGFQEAMFACAQENGFPEEFDLALLKSILKSAGGNPKELSACLSAGTYSRAVEEAIAIARELGVSGTPTFFVNGWAIPGAYPYELFRGVIDWALGRK